MGKLPPQIVGNTGLYWVCFKLSELNWNVLPTSRNTRGIDIICFRKDGRDTRSIQVKSLSRKSPVPLGLDLAKIVGDLWVVVTLDTETPRTYILTPQEVKDRAVRDKGVNKAYWLQPPSYDVVEFKERWDRIGSSGPGFQTEALPDSEDRGKKDKGGAAMEKRHLVEKLREMRRAGEPRRTAAMTHLFGMIFAEDIRRSGSTPTQIAKDAGNKHWCGYITDGQNLAGYVDVKPECLNRWRP
ncbi:MAG: hypothetical protein OXH05_02645 [Acidobacteria bacterium]|nr:hypothetical protein [Acidobacteriota bacterium]